jgi:hypothetical protein
MTNKEKYHRICKLNGLSIYSAGFEAGMKHGTLAAAVRDNRKLTDKLHNQFLRHFKVTDEQWENDLIGYNVTWVNKSDSPSLSVHRIPLYDTIAIGGLSLLMEEQVAYNNPIAMIEPGDILKSASGSLRVYGHSMFPKYPAGCIVGFREADMELILWGEDYVIELSNRRIIKRLEKHEDNTKVWAVSYNKSEEYKYANLEIPIKKIKRLYFVVGKAEIEASI